MSRRAAPLACAALLTGCVNGKINRYSTDRVTFTEVPLASTEMNPAHCDLRLCFVASPSKNGGPGALQRIILNALTPHFAAVKLQPGFPAKDCDLGLKFDNYMNGDKAELYSSHTGEFLARYQTVFRNMGSLICSTVKDGTPLFEKIPGAAVLAYRTPKAVPGSSSPPPAPAASSAVVTKEDIAAAVAAAMKQQQPAPETAPAPAGPRLPPLSKPVIFSSDRPDDLAVIVGVESYSDIAAKAPYAERDAEAFKAHVRALGVPERNIVLLTGSKASRSALVKNVEGWLPRMSKPGSRVYFYFSGHGAPDPRNGTAYLVPWDGDPNFLDATGYPVNELYKRLGELPASQVLVALDSCFSGAGGRSVLPTGARPLVGRLAPVAVPSKLTVLTASASNEISGSLDEKGHGAFTWFLLEGLNAGKRSAKELHAYLTPKVQDESRRLNRDQTPQLLGADASLR